MYLYLVVGKTGIPLSDVIRDSVVPVPNTNEPTLNQYVLMGPHHVPVYQWDNRKVLNLATTLIKDIQVGNNNVHKLMA